MKKRRLVSAILCVAAIASSLTACGETAASARKHGAKWPTLCTKLQEWYHLQLEWLFMIIILVQE